MLNEKEQRDKEQRDEERQRKRDAWEKAQALARPRHLHEDILYRGVGHRLIHLLFLGTFGPCLSFDIRQHWRDPDTAAGQEPEYVLYRSPSLPSAEGSDSLVGYERLQIDSGVLRSFVDRLYRISLPVCPPYEPVVVLDGRMYAVTFFGGVQAVCQISWRDGRIPAGWAELETVTREMVTLFQTLPAVQEAS